MPVRHLPRQARAAQRGVSLLFALLTLVAMMMATLALVRSVDTSALLAGNIGLKQDATAAADQAARQAIAWLVNNTASLNTDASSGYYASTLELVAADGSVTPPIDVTGRQVSSNNRQLIDWDGDGCKYATSGTFKACTILSSSLDDINGNKPRYVIFRLCSKPGDFTKDDTISCSTPLKSSSGGTTSKEACDYKGCPIPTSGFQPYYRVVVRVQGARNTTSFTETIVHF
jgi:type IV pilus assembly protein PilX